MTLGPFERMMRKVAVVALAVERSLPSSGAAVAER